MADAVATALNSMRSSVQLSPQDEESVQAFIADFFASSDSPDSDSVLSGIMNFNKNSFATTTVIIAKYLLCYYEYYST